MEDALLPPKRQVAGSNPAEPTISFLYFQSVGSSPGTRASRHRVEQGADSDEFTGVGLGEQIAVVVAGEVDRAAFGVGGAAQAAETVVCEGACLGALADLSQVAERVMGVDGGVVEGRVRLVLVIIYHKHINKS